MIHLQRRVGNPDAAVEVATRFVEVGSRFAEVGTKHCRGTAAAANLAAFSPNDICRRGNGREVIIKPGRSTLPGLDWLDGINYPEGSVWRL